MKLSFPAAVFLACSLASRVSCATYSQTDSYVGSQFLNGFDFQSISDPSHGRVNYVDKATAQSLGLVSSTNNSFVLRADHTTTLSANGPGRNSFRIQSNKQYTTHVAVFNIKHMPTGCGTWPSVWEVGPNWPNEGEVDIIEGVNDQGPNRSSLHTSANCQMPASRPMTGTAITNNCDATIANNSGCVVDISQSSSFGPAFNSAGGGWYAIERTTSFIKIFFWPRSSSVPSDVQNGGSSVNTNNWGTPAAYFPDTNCSISSHFGPHNIIINLDFCGHFAGTVYGKSGCPSTCVDYVNNNPSAFNDSYFDFASLNIYG